MFLRHKRRDDLVEVINPDELYNPCRREITGRFHCGEEMQEPETFAKSEMIFPSGESLPRCWLDADYLAKAA